MAKPNSSTKRSSLTPAILILCLFILATAAPAAELDTTKYFPFEEVKPGMDAYCLSVISGTKIEKFPLKVVSKIHNFRPGINRIMIIGTDEVFKKIGSVQGCSGSPLYIDNRIAGALSAGYPYCQDPIYLVTPIDEMLRIGTNPADTAGTTRTNEKLNLDFSKPISAATAYEKLTTFINQSQGTSALSSPITLATSLPVDSCAELSDMFGPFNAVPTAGITSTSPLEFDNSQTASDAYSPGGVLSLPLVYGDICITAVGTITEVVGDTVYGFGHDFLGQGPLNVPMSTGYIHTVIPSFQMSFKIGSASPVSGTLTFDESCGVVGKIGVQPKQIPITVTVDRFNDTQKRTYNAMMLNHTLYTPYLLQSVIAGPALMRGSLPDEHTVAYRLQINVAGYDPIIFEDTCSGVSVRPLLTNAVGYASTLMSNPYKDADIESISVDMTITNEDTVGSIFSVEMSDKQVKPGESIDFDIILQRFQKSKTYRKASLQIPSDLEPDQYEVFVLSGDNYENIAGTLAPHKFSAYSLPTLVDAINNLSKIKHNKIYILLRLPSDGITIRQQELPQLPNTKTLLLANPKRTTDISPYTPWVETSIDTDMVIAGGHKIIIEVHE